MRSSTPKFRLGNAIVSVHRARSVREIRDQASANKIIEAAREQLGQGLVDDVIAGDMLGDGPRSQQELAARILDGTYVVVVHDDAPRRLDAPKSVPLSSLIEGPDPEPPRLRPIEPPVEPPRVETFFALRLVTQTGGSFAGAALHVRLPDGSSHRVALDDQSSVRIDALTSGGSAQVEFVGELAPNPDAPPLGDIDLTAVPIIAADQGSLGAPTGVENTIVVDIPGPRCVRLVGALFAKNKAFVLPEVMEGIRLLAHMYGKLPDAELLVVGHTDTTGKTSRNQSLSLERAESMIQFLTDDVDGWYAYYGKETDFSRRWGKEEDLAMLAALPHGQLPYYDEEHADHSLQDATMRFQTAKGLPASGELDDPTRKALIAAYMAIDGTSLPSEVSAVAHGCGQHFLAVETEDDIEELANRRVEIFLFPDGIDPAPPASVSKAGSTEYPAWLEAIVEQRTFQPSAAGLGTLLVVTDLPASMANATSPTYRVKSTDGAYECTLAPADGMVHNGFIDLRFGGMPNASFYSMTVHELGGAITTIFEDVPFRDLSGLSARLDDATTQPFGWEES